MTNTYNHPPENISILTTTPVPLHKKKKKKKNFCKVRVVYTDGFIEEGTVDVALNEMTNEKSYFQRRESEFATRYKKKNQKRYSST